jgi:hypothetical protein
MNKYKSFYILNQFNPKSLANLLVGLLHHITHIRDPIHTNIFFLKINLLRLREQSVYLLTNFVTNLRVIATLINDQLILRLDDLLLLSLYSLLQLLLGKLRVVVSQLPIQSL